MPVLRQTPSGDQVVDLLVLIRRAQALRVGQEVFRRGVLLSDHPARPESDPWCNRLSAEPSSRGRPTFRRSIESGRLVTLRTPPRLSLGATAWVIPGLVGLPLRHCDRTTYPMRYHISAIRHRLPASRSAFAIHRRGRRVRTPLRTRPGSERCSRQRSNDASITLNSSIDRCSASALRRDHRCSSWIIQRSARSSSADSGIYRRTRVEARACPVLDSARIATLGFPDKGDSSWPAFRSLRPA